MLITNHLKARNQVPEADPERGVESFSARVNERRVCIVDVLAPQRWWVYHICHTGRPEHHHRHTADTFLPQIDRQEI